MKNFIASCIFAQGVPALLCIVVAAVDSKASCDWIRPNMGRFSCFIGYYLMENDNTKFVDTPLFRFFYLIIIIIIIINTVCYLLTSYFMWKAFSSEFHTGEDESIKLFKTVAKLFILTGKENFQSLFFFKKFLYFFRSALDCRTRKRRPQTRFRPQPEGPGHK